MVDERIHFVIDDGELVEATTKLDKSAERVKVLNRDLDSLRSRTLDGSHDLEVLSFGVDETMGQLVQLDLFGKRIKVDTDKGDKNTKLLESRVKQLLRRLPVGREMIALQRKLSALGTSAEGEGLEGLAATGISAILLLGVVMNIIKRLDRIQKQMIRDMQSFEDETRKGLDLTHEEFMDLDRDIIGFATLWEQLTDRLEDATGPESWDAIADFVISKLGTLPSDRRPQWIFSGAPRPPEPEWLLGMKSWWDTFVANTEAAFDRGYDYNANLEVPGDP